MTLGIIVTAIVFQPVESMAENVRDDGVWLFPLAQNSGYRISDWAGCTTATYCTICQKYVDKKHQSYGDSAHGSSNKYGHNGIDIAANSGTTVLATASGYYYCDTSSKGYDSRGLFVVIEHPLDEKMSYYSYYQHLSNKNTSLSNGDYVNVGEFIGKVGGSSGTSVDRYGSHLHYGIVVAPKGYFADGKNYSSKLIEYENKGWISADNYGDGGRINVNPKSSTIDENITLNIGSAVKAPLALHAGSVNYTFNTENVTERTICYSAPNISIKDATYPSKIQQGSPFGIRGVISTDVGIITSVEAYIFDVNTGLVVDGYTFKYTPWSSVYDLRKTLNNDLVFNNLKSGNYTYIVGAYAVNGTQEKYEELIHSSFEVVTKKEPNLIGSGVNEPDDYMFYKKNFGIRGTLNAVDGYISEVKGVIINSNGDIVQSSVYYPNSTSTNLRYTINNDLIFNNLKRGSYRYEVSAIVTSNDGLVSKSIQVAHKEFTVK